MYPLLVAVAQELLMDPELRQLGIFGPLVDMLQATNVENKIGKSVWTMHPPQQLSQFMIKTVFNLYDYVNLFLYVFISVIVAQISITGRNPEKKRLQTLVYSHMCDVCNKGFPSKSSLATHYAEVHTDARPFVCSTCNQTFKNKYYLRYHVDRCKQ